MQLTASQIRTSADRELRALGASITFLTRLPLGRIVLLTGDDLARSAPSFPLIGAAVGGMVGGISTVLAPTMTAPLAAAIAVTAGTVVTGALHLDGIGDTADALGARSRERTLQVMRDSSIGSYGAVAIVLDLTLRISALAVLTTRHDACVVAVVAGALSRAAPVALTSALPYARAEGGLGQPLVTGTRGRAVLAIAIAAAIAIACGRGIGLIALLVTLLVTLCVGSFYRHWLGGVTGDLLGTAIEINEIAALLVGVGLVSPR